eukprot:TRINITY_DN3468_c4_g1_i1.p1 TRINITY_DN3468_c4_g1~~TRINITY_DN3468_c4_g1_i1.p1  ORF type:complete len:283 (+),score=57.75 TRINITY_DN3468_c4_g1_i1:42-851(+)
MASKLYGLLGLAAGTGGMSAWQFHRYFWKKDLLEARESRLRGEPGVDLGKEPPADIEMVKIKGTFYNEDAILVGPKRAMKTQYGKIDTDDSYMVFVPFITAKNEHVMVCRGQVPASIISDGNLQDILSRQPNSCEIQGVFRKPERPSANTLVKRDEGLYKQAHPPMMWTDFYNKHSIKEGARKPLPYWIDITDQPFDAPDHLPLTRDRLSYASHIITPAVHLVYFSTWSLLFFISLYNLRRHGTRLVNRGSMSREQMLGGVRDESQMKW